MKCTIILHHHLPVLSQITGNIKIRSGIILFKTITGLINQGTAQLYTAQTFLYIFAVNPFFVARNGVKAWIDTPSQNLPPHPCQIKGLRGDASDNAG